MASSAPSWSAPGPRATSIDSGYWAERREANRRGSLPMQWERYEETGTIGNFRIAAGLETGTRRGFFYSDSDLHKWADAAARALRSGPSPALEARLGEYVRLVSLAQEPDGYLFTYNQLVFPGTRWKNLMIEHELYCHGHFIEAGVSHREATGRDELLDRARLAADLVVRDFRDAGLEGTPGHEEIELALLRLYRMTREPEYLEAARAFLERRGRMRLYGPRLAAQVLSHAARSRGAARRGAAAAPLGFEVGGNLGSREPPLLGLRAMPIFLGGAYQQQDAPLRKRAEPRGHAVRWTYLMTAAAMLAAETGDEGLGALCRSAWESLVGRKMYVTGGIGSLPVVEGFGRPYELDNFYSYSETCAAIGCVLWNRELSLSGPAGPGGAAAGEARFADLAEWLLYNAAAAGASGSGLEYFYRNPLASDGEIARRAWYPTACCPSNLSRLWADLDRLAFAVADGAVRIDQYVSGSLSPGGGTRVRVESALPWSGTARVEVEAAGPLDLLARVPGWADSCRITLTRGPDGGGGREELVLDRRRSPAGIFGPGRFAADYARISVGAGRSLVVVELGMPISAIRAHSRVRSDRGLAALARGPLVYCAEARDNPGLDLDAVIPMAGSLRPVPMPDAPVAGAIALEGEGLIDRGRRGGGGRVGLTLVPYSLWGNRGRGAMRVFLRADPGRR
jgi:uncharacterized protein